MLVSHCKKCAFIHVPKTGGSTITRMLSPYVDSVDPNAKRLSGWGWQITHHLDSEQHDQVVEHQDFLRQRPDYFVFAFVRNPWDRAVSLWRNWRYAGKYDGIPLAEALQCLRANHDARRTQLSYLVDGRRNLAVDLVGRFETYEADCRHILNRVGIECDTLPHELDTGRKKDYRQLYDDSTRKIVEDWFADDIRAFGYTY